MKTGLSWTIRNNTGWQTIISIIISSLLFSNLIAQDTTYACKIVGDVTCKNSGPWEKIKEGTKLINSSWIKVGAGGAVTLIKPNGYKTINGKNISCVKDIIFEKKDDTWSRLYSGLYNIFNAKPKTGGTYLTKGEEYHLLFPADGEVMLGDSVTFIWEKNEHTTAYFIFGESPYHGEMICKTEVSDTMIQLPNNNFCLDLRSFNKLKPYLWGVTQKESQQGNVVNFSFVSISTLNSLVSDLMAIDSVQTTMDKEIYYLMIAGCYEKHKMYSAENHIFKLAIKEFTKSVTIADANLRFMERVKALNNLEN